VTRWIGLVGLALLAAASAPALACQSRSNPLLDENFKNPEIGWGKPDAIADYTPRGLVMRPPVNGSAWRWNRNFSMARADLCVDAQNPAMMPTPANERNVGDVGIWFWGKDAQNFYTATIAPDGTAAIDRLVNGVWQTVVAPTRTASVRTAPGARNEIEIVTSGNSASFFVNGSDVAEFHGQAPPGGGAPGVYAESGPGITTWLFPRVRLY
jgi:hypothetical protein